jgi:hypothetical protein
MGRKRVGAAAPAAGPLPQPVGPLHEAKISSSDRPGAFPDGLSSPSDGQIPPSDPPGESPDSLGEPSDGLNQSSDDVFGSSELLTILFREKSAARPAIPAGSGEGGTLTAEHQTHAAPLFP